MDIKKAVETVAGLKRDIENINEIIEGTKRSYGDRPARISVTVWVESRGDARVKMNREDVVGLLESTRAEYLAEIDRLQPIIDMANLALKGLQKQA